MATHDSEEYGILELAGKIAHEMTTSTQVIVTIGEFLTELGVALEHRTLDLSPFQYLTPPPGREKSVRERMISIIDRAGRSIDDFSSKTNEEIPKYQHHANRAAELLSRLVDLFNELDEGTRESLRPQLQPVFGLITSITYAIQTTTGMREQLQTLPSMTSGIIKSRRRGVTCLNTLIDALEDSKESFEIALMDLEDD